MELFGIILLVLIFVPIIYVKSDFATIKGSYGERQVNKILRQSDPTQYTIHHDLYIPAENNKTTQSIISSPLHMEYLSSRQNIMMAEFLEMRKIVIGHKLFIKEKKKCLTRFGKMLGISRH